LASLFSPVALLKAKVKVACELCQPLQLRRLMQTLADAFLFLVNKNTNSALAVAFLILVNQSTNTALAELYYCARATGEQGYRATGQQGNRAHGHQGNC